MPCGRKTSLTIRLTPADRLTLLTWQRLPLTPAGLARRGRMVLLLADGMTITEAAALVGLSRWHSYKWIRRFQQDGGAGLADKPNPRRGFGPVPYALREPPTRDVS